VSGRASKIKGCRVERELVTKFIEEGIKAKRVPLSGAGRYYAKNMDGDIRLIWRNKEGQKEVLKVESKARKSGSGFATLERWLGSADFLLLKRNRAEPWCAMPWRTLVKLLKGEIREWQAEENKQATQSKSSTTDI